MMIYSILGCVKNLMWVIVVLAMTFYVFGVGFTSAVTDYMVTNSAGLNACSIALPHAFRSRPPYKRGYY